MFGKILRCVVALTLLLVGSGIVFAYHNSLSKSVFCAQYNCNNWQFLGQAINSAKPTAREVDHSYCIQHNYSDSCPSTWKCFELIGPSSMMPQKQETIHESPVLSVSQYYSSTYYSVQTHKDELAPIALGFFGKRYVCAAPPPTETSRPIAVPSTYQYVSDSNKSPVGTYVYSDSYNSDGDYNLYPYPDYKNVYIKGPYCGNLPEGWGCYYDKQYIDSLNKVYNSRTGDNLYGYFSNGYPSNAIRSEYFYASYPAPQSSADEINHNNSTSTSNSVISIGARCSATYEEKTIDGKFYNTKWRASYIPPRNGSRYTDNQKYQWSGTIASNEQIVYSYVMPGTSAKANVSATITRDGKTIKSTNSDNTCSITVPAYDLKLACTTRPFGGTDPETGDQATVYFDASVNTKARDVKYTWNNNAPISNDKLYANISVGKNTPVTSVVAEGTFGEGDRLSVVKSKPVKCPVIKIPEPKFVGKCNGVSEKSGTVTWSASLIYKNIAQGMGYKNITDLVDIEWVVRNSDENADLINNTVKYSWMNQPIPNFKYPETVLNQVIFKVPKNISGEESDQEILANCKASVCPSLVFYRQNWSATIFGGREDIKGSGHPLGGGGVKKSNNPLVDKTSPYYLWKNYSWEDVAYVAYPINAGVDFYGKTISACGNTQLKGKCMEISMPTKQNGIIQTEVFPIFDRGPDPKLKPDTIDMSAKAFRMFGYDIFETDKVRGMVTAKLVDCQQ